MKKTLLLFGILCFCVANTVFAQKKPVKKTQNILKTLLISDSLYADETEVTVEEWLYFVGNILHLDGKDSATNKLPDLRLLAPQSYNLMNQIREICKKPADNIVTVPTPKFGDIAMPLAIAEAMNKAKESRLPGTEFPITGITYEQAQAFCVWRTENLNTFIEENPKKAKKWKINSVQYRLPTPTEYDLMTLHAQDPNKDGNIDSVFVLKGCRLWNYSRIVGCDIDAELAQTYGRAAMMRIASYNPSIDGIFDILGNVAEMSSEKFISKGGHFRLPAQEGLSGTYIRYSQPEQWLGFRCIATYEFPVEKK
jgi:hypothetical protein